MVSGGESVDSARAFVSQMIELGPAKGRGNVGSHTEITNTTSWGTLFLQLSICVAFVILSSLSGVLLDRSDTFHRHRDIEQWAVATVLFEIALIISFVMQGAMYISSVALSARRRKASLTATMGKGMLSRTSLMKVVLLSLLFVAADCSKLGAIGQMGALLTDVMTSPVSISLPLPPLKLCF